MVQSKAATVDLYLAQAAPARAPTLRRLRDLARSVLTGHEERMQYGMPTYSKNGRADFAFADQKRHLALYVMQASVHARNAAALSELDCGKGCIRFARAETIDWALVEQLLADTRDSREAPCT